MKTVITNDKIDGYQEHKLEDPAGIAAFFLYLKFNSHQSVFNACQQYYLDNKATLEQCLLFYEKTLAEYDSNAALFRAKWQK